MKIRPLHYALASLLGITIASGQTSLYLNRFGPSGLFADPDSLSAGDSVGLWKVYDASYSSGPSGTYLSNLNGSVSPQGGNYWMGQLQGPGSGASNFPAHFFAGISSSLMVTSTATAPVFAHGEKYILHFYMNPFEFVTNDGSGVGSYSTGALEWSIFGSGIMSPVDGSIVNSDNSYAKTVSFGQWTDMAVPFTYDAAAGAVFNVVLGSYLTGGSNTITPITVTGSTAPGFNRVQSMAIDFGIPAAVPETNTTVLALLSSLLFFVRKRK